MTAYCATSAVRAASESLVRIASTACLTVQRPDAPCSACAVACPEDAISIRDRNVVVRAEGCSGCGLCAPTCPTGAISVARFGSADRLECVRATKPEGRTVPCLGGLTAAHLRDALEMGDVTLVDRGWCGECPVSGGNPAPWVHAVEAVNSEMATLGVPQRVNVAQAPLSGWRARAAPQPGTDNPARRGLFNRIAQGADGSGQATAIPDKAETPGLSLRARQLAGIAGKAALPRSLFPAFRMLGPVPDLAVLVRLCPTRALDLVEDETSRCLVFDATACTQCGACVATGAMSFVPAPEGHLQGPETLLSEPRATCTRCRSRFTPKVAQATCNACARDTDIAALAHGLMRRKQSISL